MAYFKCFLEYTHVYYCGFHTVFMYALLGIVHPDLGDLWIRSFLYPTTHHLYTPAPPAAILQYSYLCLCIPTFYQHTSGKKNRRGTHLLAPALFARRHALLQKKAYLGDLFFKIGVALEIVFDLLTRVDDRSVIPPA